MDFFRASRLAFIELIAWESEDLEAVRLKLFVQFDEIFVLVDRNLSL